MGRLEETVRGVARRGNPRLVIDKIVINRWRGHNEHRVRETELRNAFGDLVARTMIPELAARPGRAFRANGHPPVPRWPRNDAAAGLRRATHRTAHPAWSTRMSIQRAPALHRRVDPVAEAIPPRVDNPDPSLPAPAPRPEPLNTSLQVRVRASTRERLDEAVRKLQYERKDRRSVSLASLTDHALDAWLTTQGL